MRKVGRFIKKTIIIFSILILGIILARTVHVFWFAPDGADALRGADRADLMARRAYILEELKSGAGPDQMPEILPAKFRGEWALVTHSMAALALTNMAFLYPETAEESLKAVEDILVQVLSPEFRKFDVDEWDQDPLANGEEENGHIGYLGHLNLVLAAYSYLGGKDETYRALFSRVSRGIRTNIESSPIRNGFTYPGEVYVPDNAAALASLALYERWSGDVSGLPLRWLSENHRKYKDPVSGLLPFRLNAEGMLLQGGRGSGAAWIIFYLYYIDKNQANSEFARFKKHHLQDFYLGMKGFREWPHGNESEGDIDSGPLVFGFSPAGTGFGIAGAKFSGDAPLLESLLLTAEVVGVTFQWGGKRRYLFAPLVGDAAILAMRTLTPWKK